MLQFFDFVGLHLREFGTWLGALCTYECVYWNVRRVIEFLTLGYKIPIFETLSKHLWIGLQIDVLGIIQETFLSNVNLIQGPLKKSLSNIMKKQIFSAFSFFIFEIYKFDSNFKRQNKNIFFEVHTGWHICTWTILWGFLEVTSS